MRNYTAISIIRAQGCSGNNKSADYSSVDMGMKGNEGKMREKEIRGRESTRSRERKGDRARRDRTKEMLNVPILTPSTGRSAERGFR